MAQGAGLSAAAFANLYFDVGPMAGRGALWIGGILGSSSRKNWDPLLDERLWRKLGGS
jgi:hypothetical protein